MHSPQPQIRNKIKLSLSSHLFNFTAQIIICVTSAVISSTPPRASTLRCNHKTSLMDRITLTTSHPRCILSTQASQICREISRASQLTRKISESPTIHNIKSSFISSIHSSHRLTTSLENLKSGISRHPRLTTRPNTAPRAR